MHLLQYLFLAFAASVPLAALTGIGRALLCLYRTCKAGNWPLAAIAVFGMLIVIAVFAATVLVWFIAAVSHGPKGGIGDVLVLTGSGLAVHAAAVGVWIFAGYAESRPGPPRAPARSAPADRSASAPPRIPPSFTFTARSLRVAIRYRQDTPMRDHYRKIIELIGEDPGRPGLLDTPERAAKAMEFLTGGYGQDLGEVVNDALFPSDSSEMVIVQDIELYSLCEHHLLPFIGKCHVGYIPNGMVLGLSKVARVVDMFAHRLQIQESLTTQIAVAIEQVTGALGVGVIIEAQHMCMMMRGVEKQNSTTKTSAMLGAFRQRQATRYEFLSLISR